jgi:hypothetical protein
MYMACTARSLATVNLNTCVVLKQAGPRTIDSSIVKPHTAQNLLIKQQQNVMPEY